MGCLGFILQGISRSIANLKYIGGLNKNYRLFISVLKELERQDCPAETLTLILDNYRIHKNRWGSDWQPRHPKFNLLFYLFIIFD